MTCLAETWAEMEARHADERQAMLEAMLVTAEADGAAKAADVAVAKGDRKMRAITAAVAAAHQVTAASLFGPDRSKRIVEPRQAAFYALQQAGFKAAAIGRFFDRDHTTVLHGINAHMKRTGIN